MVDPLWWAQQRYKQQPEVAWHLTSFQSFFGGNRKWATTWSHWSSGSTYRQTGSRYEVVGGLQDVAGVHVVVVGVTVLRVASLHVV